MPSEDSLIRILFLDGGETVAAARIACGSPLVPTGDVP